MHQISDISAYINKKAYVLFVDFSQKYPFEVLGHQQPKNENLIFFSSDYSLVGKVGSHCTELHIFLGCIFNFLESSAYMNDMFPSLECGP